MENVNENFGKYIFKTLNGVKGTPSISFNRKESPGKTKSAGRDSRWQKERIDED